jgi:hypothetical protein
MGGVVPFGYDVADRALIVNPVEAALAREIFTRYLEIGRAASAWCVGHFLQSQLNCGEILRRGKICPGQHEAIVPADVSRQGVLTPIGSTSR